jgi:hypothetical protein
MSGKKQTRKKEEKVNDFSFFFLIPDVGKLVRHCRQKKKRNL